MESAKKALNYVQGYISKSPMRGEKTIKKFQESNYNQTSDMMNGSRKDSLMKNDFYFQNVNPQVQRNIRERDIPNSKKRSYQQINQFEFLGGDTDCRRILKPTIKSDFEEIRNPSIYKPTMLDNLMNIACPPIKLQCGTKLCKVSSVASSNDDNQTQATMNENDQQFQTSQFQQSLYQQLQGSKLKTQRKSSATVYDAQMEEITQEDKYLRVKKYLKSKEESQFQVKTGLERLWYQIDEGISSKERILNQNGQSLNKTSFYELQPHIIYQSCQIREFNINQQQQLEFNDAGLIADLQLAYIVQNNQVIFWNINKNQRETQFTIVIDQLRYGSVISIQHILFQKNENQHFIVIVTELEVLIYLYHIEKYENKFSLVQKNKDDQILNEYHRDIKIYQSQINNRIFMGGSTSEVKELRMDQTQKWGSFISCLMISSCANIKNGGKFSVINQAPSNVVSKFLGKILNSQNQNLQVKAFTEHQDSNSLFCFVADTQNSLASYIQVYDLGHSGDGFKQLFQISLESIIKDICQNLNINFSEDQFNNVEIHKMAIVGDSSLRLIFENGFKITLQLTFQESTQNKDLDEEILQNKTQEIINSWKVVDIQQIPFQRLIDQYLSLFNTIEQKDHTYCWKPLVSDPIYMSNENLFTQDCRITILDSDITQNEGKEIYLIKQFLSQNYEQDGVLSDTLKEYTRSFVISIVPNYRREGNLKNTQSLVGIVEISDEAVALSQQIKDSQKKRTSFEVMTISGIVKITIPSDLDIIVSYLQLILMFEGRQRDQQAYIVKDMIQRDLLIYFQGQNIQESLLHLIEIITSRQEEQFISNRMNIIYYQNIGKQIGHGCTDLESALGLIKSASFIQYLNNYHKLDDFELKNIPDEVKQRAFELFLEITDSALDLQFDTLIQKDEQYQIFWNNLKKFNETSVLNQRYQYIVHENARLNEKSEYLRVKCLYRYLFNQIKEFIDTKIFKYGIDYKTQNQKIEANLSSELLQKAESKLKSLKNFIISQRQSIISIHDDYPIDHLSLSQEMECFSKILDRFIDGMKYLYNLLTWDFQNAINQIQNNDEKLDLLTISFFEFIEKDLASTQIGFLIEKFIAQQCSSADLLRLVKDKNFIRDKSDSFVDESALLLIFGRKLFQDALSSQLKLSQNSKNKYHPMNSSIPAQEATQDEIEKMKKLGFDFFLRCAKQVNLNNALKELMKNKLPIDSVTLCVRRFDELDIYLKVIKDSYSSPNETIEQQEEEKFIHEQPVSLSQKISQIHRDQQECILIIHEIIEEIIKRIHTIKEEKDSKEKNSKRNGDDQSQQFKIIEISKYDAIKEFVRILEGCSNKAYLEDQKQKIYSECIKSKSYIFHQGLYDKLMIFSQLSDIMKFESPFAKEYLEKINQGGDETSIDQDVQISLKQRSDLQEQKIQATFQHLSSNQLFGEAYLFLMEQTCGIETILDIKSRISWINKGEGCLQKYNDKMKVFFMQDENQRDVNKLDIKIQDSQIKQYETFKDYFLQVLQIKDAIINKIRKIQRYCKDDDEIQYRCQNLYVIEERLTYQVMDVNEIYQIALEYKRWLEYLDILRLTELKDLYKKDQDTQSRINYLYETLLDHYYRIDLLLQNPKKFVKFVNVLSELHRSSLTFDKNNFLGLQIDLFPMTLLIQNVESQNMRYLESNRDFKYLKVINSEIKPNKQNQIVVQEKKFREWNPLWHVQFFGKIDFLMTYDILNKLRSFNMPYQQKQFYSYIYKHNYRQSFLIKSSQSISSLLQPKLDISSSPTPEYYLSLAYLLIFWDQQKLLSTDEFSYHTKSGLTTADIKLKKVEMQSLSISLKLSIQDELLFNKQYLEEIKIIIKNLDDTLIKL